MKTLVTGGSGFIGSHLTDLLLQHNCHVKVIDNLCTGRLENLSDALKSPYCEFIQADIREYEQIAEHFKGIDWVFHLAGLADLVPSIEHPEKYYSTNVTGTFNVLQASKEAKVAKVLYAASSSCYGMATTFPTKETDSIAVEHPYALTKYLGEQLVSHWDKVFHIPTISLRLFNAYGPRSRTTGAYGAVFGVFLAQKLHNKPLTVVGDGSQKRDFVYVKDVANAFYVSAKSTVQGEIMNVGGGNPYTVNVIADLIGGEKSYIPKRPKEPDCTWANIEKITQKLGWYPKVSLKEGVSILLSHIEEYKDAPVWDEKTIDQATKTWFSYLK